VTRRRRRPAAVGLVAVLIGAAVPPAASQVLVGMLAGGALSSEKFNIGFDIGMNFSTLTGMGDASRYNGPLFGLFADWRFSEKLHFTGGLIPLSYRGANELVPVLLGDPTIDSLTSGGTMSRSMSTIDVPLILKFAPKRDTGPRVGVGCQFVLSQRRYTAESPAGAGPTGRRHRRPAKNIGRIAFDVEWRWDRSPSACYITTDD
jgi:hypothetical protein